MYDPASIIIIMNIIFCTIPIGLILFKTYVSGKKIDTIFIRENGMLNNEIGIGIAKNIKSIILSHEYLSARR